MSAATLLAALLLAASLLAAWFLGGEGSSSTGEELYAPGFEDVATSAENTTLPPTDTSRFAASTQVVYVYLVVEDLPSAEGLKARIERSGRGSVLSWLLGKDELQVRDEKGELLNPTGDGVSGVVKFAVRATSGDALPAGEYTLSVYAPSEGAKIREAARKNFVVVD